MSAPYRLGEMLRLAYERTPTERLPVTGPFLALWQDAAGDAYGAPDFRLLDLLLVNRVIAAQAAGPEGEPYARQARANMVRLTARLGEGFPTAAAVELWHECPDEVRFLNWCVWWARGREDEARLADWTPASDLGEVLRAGCGVVGAASDLDVLRMYSRQADLPGEQNRPLNYLRRLARLEEARLLLAAGQREEAGRMAAGAGVDGELLCMGVGPPRGYPALGVGAEPPAVRYRAYRARRLAERLELLGFTYAARRWRDEQAGWERLRENETGRIDMAAQRPTPGTLWVAQRPTPEVG